MILYISVCQLMMLKAIRLGLYLLLSFLLVSCGDSVPEQKIGLKKPKVVTHLTALPEKVKSPKENPPTPEKILLGRLLFYDPILSGGKDVACATCHHPDNGYAEFLDISIGPNAQGLGSKRRFNANNDIPFMKRNAPTIINTAFNSIDPYGRYGPEKASMFWDDRAKSLELQALEPIKAFEEMRGHGHGEMEILQTVIERLKKIPTYQKLFTLAFGNADAVSIDNLGKAIAVFERTIIANNSRFDQYMRGDKDAISISEKEGLKLFKSVGCINCHNGPMFSDYKMHVLGVPENDKLSVPDAGVEGTFAFRTPSLRNLRFTAPYMHNGSLSSLRLVLEFYEDISDGKERNANVSKEKYDPFVREIKLSVKEMSQIISFLSTLNDDGFDRKIPDTVPSGLPVGGNIH